MSTETPNLPAERPHVATVLRHLPDFNGSALLYRLDRPMQQRDMDGGVANEFDHVIASAVPRAFDTKRAEVLIFPATPDGEILSWAEIGGQRDTLDHNAVMRDAGFEVQ